MSIAGDTLTTDRRIYCVVWLCWLSYWLAGWLAGFAGLIIGWLAGWLAGLSKGKPVIVFLFTVYAWLWPLNYVRYCCLDSLRRRRRRHLLFLFYLGARRVNPFHSIFSFFFFAWLHYDWWVSHLFSFQARHYLSSTLPDTIIRRLIYIFHILCVSGNSVHHHWVAIIFYTFFLYIFPPDTYHITCLNIKFA